jgi:transglutaminase-like putative cysteine protease
MLSTKRPLEKGGSGMSTELRERIALSTPKALAAFILAAVQSGCQTPPHSSSVHGDGVWETGADSAARDEPTPHASGPAAPSATTSSEPTSNVMTADIQAGIEKHIADTTARHGGYFPLVFEGKEMHLKLVRVHTEYLANLGPRRHFACVDLANIDGNVYDVDFFLEGESGAMVVTETTVHKLNGVPYYLWKQNDDDTWVRESVTDATDALLGVVRGRDAFEFDYDARLPELSGPARAWLPIPRSDRFQTVTVEKIAAPGRREIVTDNHGNRVLILSLGPEDSGKPISMRFRVERLESGPYTEPATSTSPASPAPEAYLNAESLVPDLPAFRTLAAEVTEGRSGDLARARAIFDHTIETFKYQRYGTGWGRGDAVRACDARSGNCTDFHAYFIALSRAASIPARFAIGAAIPSERGEGGIDGYHCWAEFHAEGKWWPVDLSEANKYSPLSTYYFGHHPANRVELSRGRDLEFPSGAGPASGPINFLAYPVLEIEGTPVTVIPRFTFRRTQRPPAGEPSPAASMGASATSSTGVSTHAR